MQEQAVSNKGIQSARRLRALLRVRVQLSLIARRSK